ncbi:muramidase family protein [Pontiella agarivorans]|uniref:LysM peptidoglycan-binding domain-containing protein n=1 Tax=Pontiella agarivorans TaxID=3038953 RepID=A0ABU5MSL0_9BACT|nr:LysM peptidoglycan-binding domain-containing protein [Pontiella agarivorans]MDZ8117123.1 LysM peptidoglycan-binding domain-containing protein [Pontiella agarivorans]
MKIGSSFFMAVAVLSALALTQGCVTTESQGSVRGPGAKTKGPFWHNHKSKSADEGTAVALEPYESYEDAGADLYVMEDDISTSDYQGGPNTGASSYGETEVYIVQKGDVLSQIAVDCDTTTATLVQMNGLSNPDVLYVGQELRVPAGSKGTVSKPTGTVKSGGIYIIQKGDTLSEIALAAGVTLNDLREVNGLKGDVIMAGEELNIPSYGKVPSSARKARSTKTVKSDPEPQMTEPEPQMTEPEPQPLAAFEDSAPAPIVEVDNIVVDEVMYPGETLDDKARQYGVSKAEIMRLNGITDESQIREGQTIRIPVSD